MKGSTIRRHHGAHEAFRPSRHGKYFQPLFIRYKVDAPAYTRTHSGNYLSKTRVHFGYNFRPSKVKVFNINTLFFECDSAPLHPTTAGMLEVERKLFDRPHIFASAKWVNDLVTKERRIGPIAGVRLPLTLMQNFINAAETAGTPELCVIVLKIIETVHCLTV